MNLRKNAYKVIDEEREYQEDLLATGRYQQTFHSVGEEVLIISEYADKARKAHVENYGDNEALKVIRKIAALCVRCMENHGAISRYRKEKP